MMIVNPPNLAPDDTPAIVVEVAAALAVYVLPALFLLICLGMLVSRTKRTPCFSYVCALAAPRCLGLRIASANSPLSVLALLAAFPVCPVPSAINLRQLRACGQVSPWHRGARWVSLLSIAPVFLFIGWAAFESLVSWSAA